MTAARRLTLTAPFTVMENVDPTTAAKWLERNVRNRHLRRSIVARYARDMAAGNWRVTGESIKFANNGDLLDGQHRLAAIVESGVTVGMFVTRNLDNDAQVAMDSGTRRTASDAFSLIGGKNTALATATARLALGMELALDGGKYNATHAEILTFIGANPDLRDAVDFAQAIFRRTDCLPTVVAYTTWRLARIDATEAERFWIDAADKVGLTPGDPVLALTNRLAEARRKRERVGHTELVSAVFRAWNARRDGATVRRLPLTKNGEAVTMQDPR